MLQCKNTQIWKDLELANLTKLVNKEASYEEIQWNNTWITEIKKQIPVPDQDFAITVKDEDESINKIETTPKLSRKRKEEIMKKAEYQYKRCTRDRRRKMNNYY